MGEKPWTGALMPNLNDLVTGFVAGDDLSVERTLTNISTSDLLFQAWLTVRDSGDDTAITAILTKGPVTTVGNADGQITDDGATDGIGMVRFDLTPADTRLIGMNGYFHDIQVRKVATKTYPPVKGIIRAEGEVTSL